jgi:putative ABC transport system permease protein
MVGGPLWTKAPTALARYPGLLGSIVIGALLVSIVAAAYPLFLSRSEGALLKARIAESTISRYGAGLFYGMTSVRLDEQAPGDEGLLRERLDEEFGRLAAAGPHLGQPIRYVLGAAVLVTLPGGIRDPSGDIDGVVFGGTDAAANVDVLSGSGADGALIPDIIADPFELHPGDAIELEGNRKVEIRVGGIYRSFYDDPRMPYWLPWSEQFYRCALCPVPRMPIVVGEQEAIDLTRAVGNRSIDLGWVAPVTGLPLTMDEAREVNDYTRAVKRQASEPKTELGRLLACCGISWPRGYNQISRATELRSAMPLVLREVERRAASVQGPLRLLLIAGLAVAAATVAAAAAFAVAGRRTEAALLHARGWGPIRFAAKAMLESAIPVVLGASAGLALGWWLTVTFGPAAPTARSARIASSFGDAAAAAVALLVIGVASGVSFVRTFEVHSFKLRLARPPWEILAIGGSLWVLDRLRSGGALIADARLDIRRPSALLLAFPVLFLAGFATLGARLLVQALRGGRSSTGGSQGRYLALRRLTASPRLTVLLVGAAGVCLGVFVNGQTMVSSLRSTVDAKARVFVGSDVAVWVDHTAPIQERFPLPITRATRLRYAGSLLPGNITFDMVGVDPETFARAAFWDDEFSNEPLDELVGRLRSPSGPLPIVLVHADVTPTAIAVDQVEIPVAVVGRAEAFPGASSRDPVAVVDVRSLEQRLGAGGDPLMSQSARTEYWIKGDIEEALASVDELVAYPLGIVTADEVKDVPFVAAAIDTFAMLNVLGLAAAVLVIGVVIVYLQSRQRSRAVAHVLSLRMGMTRGQATIASVLELGVMLFAAFVLGGALAIVASYLVAPLLDPLQTIPPPPLFTTPTLAVVWTFLGVAVVAAGGGWFVQWRAGRIDLGEVLRVAE